MPSTLNVPPALLSRLWLLFLLRLLSLMQLLSQLILSMGVNSVDVCF